MVGMGVATAGMLAAVVAICDSGVAEVAVAPVTLHPILALSRAEVRKTASLIPFLCAVRDEVDFEISVSLIPTAAVALASLQPPSWPTFARTSAAFARPSEA